VNEITAVAQLSSARQGAVEALVTDAAAVLGHHVGVDHIPGPPLRQEVTIGLGTPVSNGDTTRWALTWEPVGHQATLPAFRGVLEVDDAVDGGATVRVTGTYRPPLALLGAIVDRVIGHRLAEATIEDFVAGVARRIDRHAALMAEHGSAG
jgi:hypothetical protein